MSKRVFIVELEEYTRGEDRARWRWNVYERARSMQAEAVGAGSGFDITQALIHAAETIRKRLRGDNETQ